MFGLFKKDPDKLLKAATKARESGDLVKAISTLRDAYKAIAKTDVSYPVETFIRLPLYLQEAGDGASAWREFNELVQGKYHRSPSDKDLVPMEQSTVYDKMRLFLQREGQPALATAYGIACHFSWGLGLHKQKRVEELERYLSQEVVRETVTKLLKKAKMINKIDSIIEVLDGPRTNIGRVAPSQLIMKVCDVLGVPADYQAEQVAH
jgi:hypothetical protein